MKAELLFTGAAICMIVCGAILAMVRHERDAWLGRQLRTAAGSEHAARLAIESANLDRLLSQKFDGELERAQKRRATGHRLPPNVVRLMPRILNRGKTVHFEPPGAA